ncbi:hypothetical protein NE237_029370 [Protea cynaroides]|uniref:Uncharacterized protein n=1 Tax=Protea cynaroides TaxID=273540 RepID=A0A9Q0GTS2_9MAGN|nr:hypothetical protein NE237_029370 [Protea cynaroides]
MALEFVEEEKGTRYFPHKAANELHAYISSDACEEIFSSLVPKFKNNPSPLEDKEDDEVLEVTEYGYIDVVYDAYSMKLKDILDGKTVNFSVKVFLLVGVKELILGSDSDVLHMFCEYENEDQPIQYFVFGFEVSKEFSINYIVHWYHKSLLQRSCQTMVEKSLLNNKKNVSKKTLCKKTITKKTLSKTTVFTLIVQRFAITGVSNNIGDISNSSVTIHRCGRDYVQRRGKLTPGASSSQWANTYLVNLSSDEDCDSDDHSIDEQVGDEIVGDEAIRDEAVRDEKVGDEKVGDEKMGDDDSMDFEWGKDGIEVGDDDSIDSEKDLKGEEDMGGVVDSDGKLSDCKSDD